MLGHPRLVWSAGSWVDGPPPMRHPWILTSQWFECCKAVKTSDIGFLHWRLLFTVHFLENLDSHKATATTVNQYWPVEIPDSSSMDVCLTRTSMDVQSIKYELELTISSESLVFTIGLLPALTVTSDSPLPGWSAAQPQLRDPSQAGNSHQALNMIAWVCTSTALIYTSWTQFCLKVPAAVGVLPQQAFCVWSFKPPTTTSSKEWAERYYLVRARREVRAIKLSISRLFYYN